VHFGLRLLHLRAVVAWAGDAGVGAGFSGAAHDGGEVGFGGRLKVGFLSGDGLALCGLGGGWRRGYWFWGVGTRNGCLLDLAGQRDFVEGVR
jgi:hypothetical protein